MELLELPEPGRVGLEDVASLELLVAQRDADLGQPNLFVAIDESMLEKKISLLYEHFPTQAGRTWFDKDTFRGLARLRGVECAAPGRFAEAFHCRKMRIAPPSPT